MSKRIATDLVIIYTKRIINKDNVHYKFITMNKHWLFAIKSKSQQELNIISYK